MKRLLFIALLFATVTTVNAQTWVRGHYSRTGNYIRGHYRPYYPGDIYRRQAPVILLVPGASLNPSNSRGLEIPSINLPSGGDNTGMWVESLEKREENGRIGLEFAKQEAARIDRENAAKKAKSKN